MPNENYALRDYGGGSTDGGRPRDSERWMDHVATLGQKPIPGWGREGEGEASKEARANCGVVISDPRRGPP